MKISKVNTSFTGIHKHSFNYEKEPVKAYVLNLFAAQRDADLVFNNQGYDSVRCFIDSTIRCGIIPSLNWLVKHAELKNIKLPDYVANNEIDAYVITGEDKEQYEKLELSPKKADKIVKKAFKKELKNVEDDGDLADAVIKVIIDYDKQEQEKFDEFLKEKKINPMKIDIHM